MQEEGIGNREGKGPGKKKNSFSAKQTGEGVEKTQVNFSGGAKTNRKLAHTKRKSGQTKRK
jgi:hypothetical protein